MKIYNHKLLRLRLKLMKYDFLLKRKLGKKLHITYLLSRDYIQDPVEDDQTIDEMEYSVSKHLSMSAESIQEFKNILKVTVS